MRLREQLSVAQRHPDGMITGLTLCCASFGCDATIKIHEEDTPWFRSQVVSAVNANAKERGWKRIKGTGWVCPECQEQGGEPE